MITSNRVLAGASQDETELGVRIRIPVRHVADGDRKDVRLRQHIRRWLREHLTSEFRIHIRDRFSPLQPGDMSFTGPDGTTFQLAALLEFEITIDREGEIDRFKKQQRRKKAEAHKDFLQTLTESRS